MILTKGEKDELRCIGLCQPVFAGDVLAKETAKALIEKRLALKYEDDYCLNNNTNSNSIRWQGKYGFAESELITVSGLMGA